MVDLEGVWSRVKQRAKLDDRIRLYDACRHTFTTWALELGVPLERVKMLIGHSTDDMTARYTHLRTSVLPEDADLVASRIDAALRGATIARPSDREPDSEEEEPDEAK